MFAYLKHNIVYTPAVVNWFRILPVQAAVFVFFLHFILSSYKNEQRLNACIAHITRVFRNKHNPPERDLLLLLYRYPRVSTSAPPPRIRRNNFRNFLWATRLRLQHVYNTQLSFCASSSALRINLVSKKVQDPRVYYYRPISYRVRHSFTDKYFIQHSAQVTETGKS